MNYKYLGDYLNMFIQYRKDDIVEGRFTKIEKVTVGTDLMLRLMEI